VEEVAPVWLLWWPVILVFFSFVSGTGGCAREIA
jgi:hypothetical protein